MAGGGGVCVCVGGGGEAGGRKKERKDFEISCGIVCRGESLMQF